MEDMYTIGFLNSLSYAESVELNNAIVDNADKDIGYMEVVSFYEDTDCSHFLRTVSEKGMSFPDVLKMLKQLEDDCKCGPRVVTEIEHDDDSEYRYCSIPLWTAGEELKDKYERGDFSAEDILRSGLYSEEQIESRGKKYYIDKTFDILFGKNFDSEKSLSVFNDLLRFEDEHSNTACGLKYYTSSSKYAEFIKMIVEENGSCGLLNIVQNVELIDLSKPYFASCLDGSGMHFYTESEMIEDVMERIKGYVFKNEVYYNKYFDLMWSTFRFEMSAAFPADNRK